MNCQAASESLSQRGLWIIEIRPQKFSTALGRGRQSMPVAQLALGLRLLADLLQSGVPLARALAIFEELAPRAWRHLLPGIRDSVREGRGLAASLGAAPVQLSSEIIGIIQAGEVGGNIPEAVRRAADLTDDVASARAALHAALAYPFILVIAGTAAISLLVGLVLPRFAVILADFGQSLPATTRVVLMISKGLRKALPAAGVMLPFCLVLWHSLVGTPRGRRIWHKGLLRVPLLGSLRRSAAMSRTCGTLCALLESGVPLVAALPHAALASGDAAISDAIMAARQSVLHGERLSSALALHAAATPTVNRLTRVGEESGRLAAMLAHAGRLEREQTIARTKAFVRLLEPSLIMIMGLITAFVAAALLQALYSLRPVS